MAKQKHRREKGKVKLSEYFKELKDGTIVAIDREKSIPISFPKRMQGRTGVIESRRGDAYIVRLQDFDKEKRFIIKAIHLKKLEGKR